MNIYLLALVSISIFCIVFIALTFKKLDVYLKEKLSKHYGVAIRHYPGSQWEIQSGEHGFLLVKILIFFASKSAAQNLL